MATEGTSGVPRRLADSAYNRFLGIRIDETKPGFARLSLRTGPNVSTGIHGSVHGGILASIADIAMLEALLPMLGDTESPGGTIDLNLSYLRPALGDRIFIEASVLRKGRLVAVTEVSILDSQHRLCARGRVLYAVRPTQATRGGHSV